MSCNDKRYTIQYTAEKESEYSAVSVLEIK